MLISVILSTYNRPRALGLVLESLGKQTDHNFEVVIADDGSGEETKKVIESKAKHFPVPLKHAWQSDKGFRAAAARNAAVRISKGDYLVFLDGDCLVFPDFIEEHRRLSQKGKMVTGNRALFSKEFTESILKESSIEKIFSLDWAQLVQEKKLNRLSPLKRSRFFDFFRNLFGNKWEKIRTCNLGVWKKDFIQVNGFDESFEGWGFEDSELAVRLLNIGIRRKSGNFATGVLHLFHYEGKRKQEGKNWEKLCKSLSSHKNWTPTGLKKNKE